ncbi:hypothetical protein CEUSTIGMA_g11095.t1 [Chlamydomonas eustigma]|uniref:PRORP domain-containing protein n=1 Tax=Chlamydomonas eustigma TaxID=1157962 RepID=A0A250XLK9_9CHLO|nr:hypothetical protein CEUSTIGMA_g11095.t1 [Chlamydomonas eustigma]|eukprot:GAX83670.1 hypothetical protein CEUSTIGMA_g11095.t1 [Chlamydomonas eustigma]
MCRYMTDLLDIETSMPVDFLHAGVFHRMSRELNQLNPATMKLIEDFFNSPKAVHAFSKAAIDEREAMATDYEAQAEVRRLKRLEEAEALLPEFEHRRKVATEKRARLMEKYGGGTTALSGGRNHPPHAMTSQMKSSDELVVGAFSTTRDLPAYGSGAEVRRLLVNSKQGHRKEAANNPSSISSSSEEGEIRATEDEEEVSTLKGVTLHGDPDTRTDLIMTAVEHTRSSPRNESAAEDQMESGRVRMNTAHGGRSSRARSPRHTGSPSAISPPPRSPSTDQPGPASGIRMTTDRDMDSASEHGQMRSVGEPSSSLYHGSGAVNEDGAQQRVQNGINYLGDASASCEQAVLPGRPWLRYGLANQWQTAAGVKVDGHGRVAEGVVGGGEVELGVVDLEEEEWCLFADAISQLAMSRELKEDFKYYMDWYDRNGPYDVLVDGANVAFYGQNWEGGGFCWPHVQSMMQLVKKEFPGKKVLLMLHKRRTKDPEARTPQVQEFLESLKATKSFYFTPQGSNDDWYWLYATVKAKQSGLLVSNDELRDHIWSLLRPKHFLKWKARHIAHYTFNSEGDDSKMPRLTRPPKYSQCIQELPDGTWMFPAEDGTWFCARPASAAAL